MGRKPDPATVYQCVEAFATDDPVPGFVARRGDRLRGDHPVVVKHPRMFVADGADVTEVEARRRELYDFLDHPQPHIPAAHIPAARDIPLERRVLVRETFRTGLTGAWLPKGQAYDIDDAIVTTHPEMFETAPRPLGGR